ncbi:Sterol desaturase/sphingolipid hydroxylase, fatty acid hydroxylase superfamily [Flavobacterium fluvii]|uniref:Sterol desaturase/sphingolipid hydroxylase, fatty acid hydroxylase superfamily n=1 Tax=Flavobacterium fluvii TaxID=468056 RepID=A0A1M5DSM9_9FLAO|nr:sterol desaturase family protein [Flavobacterium fluvii]SHF70038.1 Sterol desaturase/sphingolipid hydroxylase, fatty acid hydroxylase superfamily [Flavobacterium fluvii]
MKLNFMALAIPFFVFFMLLEYYVSKKKNKEVYHFNESIANLNVGIVERISDLLTTGSFFFVFDWLYKNYSLFKIEPSITSWVLLFLATDLIWYWYHRFGHKINLFWAAHVVHHQSDDFNYSAAARITVFQAIARGTFWSVLPIIGFNPEMITILLLIHGTYPFFTHTQLVGNLGWLEHIIVTPTHHKLHHSSNPEYLDKNYGDMLIIWDKIFGTYVEESVKPEFGLTESLDNYSFLWQHFHYVLELVVSYRLAKNIKEKLKVIFGGPEDIDPRIRILLEKKMFKEKSSDDLSANLVNAIKFKTVETVIVLFFTILFSHYLLPIHLLFLTLFIVISSIITGAMLEQKRWIFHLEYIRFVIVCLIVNTFFDSFYSVSFAIIVLTLLFYKNINYKYQQFLFLN